MKNKLKKFFTFILFNSTIKNQLFFFTFIILINNTKKIFFDLFYIARKAKLRIIWLLIGKKLKIKKVL